MTMNGDRFSGDYSDDWLQISLQVKGDANWKCVRCGHPNDRISGHVLTVHHLTGDKSLNRWWNLAALCQKCHLHIQAKVIMERVWMFDHSEWFKPYVAGYYAHQNGLPDDRIYVEAHIDDLIALGQGHISIAAFEQAAPLDWRETEQP